MFGDGTIFYGDNLCVFIESCWCVECNIVRYPQMRGKMKNVSMSNDCDR